MEENIYKQARLRASKKNPEFSTVERTYPKLYISREKLLMIEQNDPHKRKAIPTQDEVVVMATAYNAPQLRNYYCTHQCPVGKGETPLMYESLSEISASLMSSLHFLDRANDRIHSILRDSQITENEKAEFKQIIETLKNIAYSANSLELWAQKNGLIEKSDTN